METNLDKLHTSKHSTSIVNGNGAATTQELKNGAVEAKNCKKAEEVRVKEDKKSHEFTTISLLYSEKSKKAPKSIAVHSFTKFQDLRFIAKSEELFFRYVKMQAQMIQQEIKAEREIKYHEAHWQTIKKAFHARLNEINQKRKGKI